MCRALGADRERGDRGDGDGGADAHDEGRGNARPEQSLRQREDEDNDCARAGPQANGDDCGQTTLPAAWTRQFLRFGSVRVPPRQNIFFMVVVAVIMVVIVVGAMTVPMIMMGVRQIMLATGCPIVIVMNVILVCRCRRHQFGRPYRMQRFEI